MLQQSAVNCVPKSSVFQGDRTGYVSHTQVYPSAFRVNYFADGSGRDTFVKTDNGGFFKAYTPAPATPVTTFMTRKRYDPPAPVIKSRAV